VKLGGQVQYQCFNEHHFSQI